MKKITLLTFVCLLFTVSTFSQVASTPRVYFPTTVGGIFAAQIEVTPTEVRLGIVAPEDRWFAVGFGGTNMDVDGNDDVVIYDGINGLLTDRRFVGQGSEPIMDSNQDWTIYLDTTDFVTYPDLPPGHRAIGAARPLTGSDANDYVFNINDTSINLVWAHGNGALGAGSFNVGYHGAFRGATMTGFTLSVENFDLSEFKISPNPVTSEFNIELPSNIESANVEVYDVLGKKIHETKISNFNSIIDASRWHSGIYIVRVSSGDISKTKRIIKQ